MSIKRKVDKMAEAAAEAAEDIAKRVGLIQEYVITPDGKETRIHYDKPPATVRFRYATPTNRQHNRVTPKRPKITRKAPKLRARRGRR